MTPEWTYGILGALAGAAISWWAAFAYAHRMWKRWNDQRDSFNNETRLPHETP